MQAELGKPSLLQPDKGKVSIYIDCSSTAEPAFEVCIFCFLSSLFSELPKRSGFLNIIELLSTLKVDSKTNK